MLTSYSSDWRKGNAAPWSAVFAPHSRSNESALDRLSVNTDRGVSEALSAPHSTQ